MIGFNNSVLCDDMYFYDDYGEHYDIYSDYHNVINNTITDETYEYSYNITSRIIENLTNMFLLFACYKFIKAIYNLDYNFNKLDNVIINQTKRIKSNQHDLYLVMRSINKVNAQLHDNKNELEKIKQYIDKRCDNIMIENNELDIYIKNKFKKIVKKIKHIESKNREEHINTIVSVDNGNCADDEHTHTE